MASNKPNDIGKALGALACLALIATVLEGCSVAGPRQSPIVGVTQNSPTVLDTYRGQGRIDQTGQTDQKRPSPRDLLHAQSHRAVAPGDGQTARYWPATEPMRQRFAHLPNPDLVMVVFAHLAGGKYPVPGYVTTFPMYVQPEYALPGEEGQ